MNGIRSWRHVIGTLSLFAIVVVVVGQMRHDGVIVINCSDYPVYANMSYTVLGVEYQIKSALLPRFNKLTVVKYPPVIDNCSVNMIFYMQPKGKGEFYERGRATIPADRGECYYLTPPMVKNSYRLCEIERVLMGIRTCPDLWVLDDNFQKKTLRTVPTATTKAAGRGPAKTTKEGGPKPTPKSAASKAAPPKAAAAKKKGKG